MYDKERTILDIIKDKDRIDAQVFSEAIKSYFAGKEKNLLKLSKYAIKMNMEQALKRYTEVLLMKTSEQIKGAIRNISKKTGVNPNSLLQMCLFEGILEKLSKSKYSENFILKGGLLISSLIGVDMRSTMDMDTTLRGIPLNEVSITKILNEILAIEIDADIEYKLIKLSPIRQEDVYEDFCASISCIFGKINATLNIDITTGDVITPREMNYSYSKILEEGTIPIVTYTIETILAEKFETISSRNITTTRARDFYDLYMIYSIYKDKIDKGILRKAIERTSKYRGSFETALQYKEIVELFRESETPKKLWKKYTQNNPYAKDVDFLDTISVYEEIGTVLNVNDDTK